MAHRDNAKPVEKHEKYAWCGRIIGDVAEYVRRHEQIWPEMKEALAAAGITNYSIWNVGDRLFGYYECRYGADFAARVQGESPVVARWNAYMSDVLELETDPETGAQRKLAQVFSFDSVPKS